MSVQNYTSNVLRVTGPEKVEFERQPVSRPQPNQILVEVFACGVCGSDLRYFRQGVSSYPYFGHEFSGVVRECGSEIDDFKSGDRITTGLVRGCGICDPCKSGFPNFCRQALSPYSPGGFSEFCLITCADGCRPLTKIPDQLDSILATLHEPLSCAMRIRERAAAKKGARALVLGLGMMGSVSGLLLKRMDSLGELVGADTNIGRTELAKKNRI